MYLSLAGDTYMTRYSGAQGHQPGGVATCWTGSPKLAA
jgi:hypothetical protein